VVRIVKAERSDNFNKKLQTPHFGQNISGSKHDPDVLTKRTRKKDSIRRVMVPFQGEQGGPFVTYKTIGGNTNWRSSPAAEILTDNPNPKFDPTPDVRSAQKKMRDLGVQRGTKGHGKVIENYTGSSANRGQKINKR
jgi:hypothetical protein